MSIRARVWTALLVPAFTWFLFEQGLSALLHSACGQVTIGVLWGVASLLLCAFFARRAWSLTQVGPETAAVWLARLATGMAGLFGLAIACQTLAILVVPPCVG